MKTLKSNLNDIPFVVRFLVVAVFCLLAQLPFYAFGAQSGGSESTNQFMNLEITTLGKGRDLLFIPGLNSSSDSFRNVCTALEEVRCRLIQLPGFAGTTAIDNVAAGFLPEMEEQVLAYIKSEQIQNPVIVGHSLGGFIALQAASNNPEIFDALIIVDSLPFLPAAQYPGATVETVKVIADNMKKSILTTSDDQYNQRIPQQLMGMTRDKEGFQTLIEWSKTSDRRTMAQAMYELQTTDLRESIQTIEAPVLIFGAWAAYENFGTTKQLTEQMYARQYQALANKSIHISDESYHFIMWDDKDWLVEHMKSFLETL